MVKPEWEMQLNPNATWHNLHSRLYRLSTRWTLSSLTNVPHNLHDVKGDQVSAPNVAAYMSSNNKWSYLTLILLHLLSSDRLITLNVRYQLLCNVRCCQVYLNKNLLINKKILSLVSISSSCVICSAARIKCNLFILEYFTFSMCLCLALARSWQSPRHFPKKMCQSVPESLLIFYQVFKWCWWLLLTINIPSHPTPFWSRPIATQIHLSETVSNRTKDHFFNLFFFLLLNPLLTFRIVFIY